MEEKIIQIAKEKMMLDHLVVRKLPGASGGGTTLNQQELDEILRFGAADLFSQLDNATSQTWDDEAVDKLLDRSRYDDDTTTATQSGADDYLNSFKVANFTPSNSTSASADASEESSADFWEKLLRDRYTEEKGKEDDSLGKGKRWRKSVKYTVDDASSGDDEWMDDSKKSSDEDEDEDDEKYEAEEALNMLSRAAKRAAAKEKGELF